MNKSHVVPNSDRQPERSADLPTAPPPRWMVVVLWLAAVYNLAWGTFVILQPTLLFEWAGLTAPNYPSLVQCLGMVIGVYGIGYAIAARDPAAHWPIVLVGLLGKVFGPIGFVWAASHGEWPWSAGWMIVANDLVWWPAFLGMLSYAVRSHDCRQLDQQAASLETELRSARTDQGATLWDMSYQQPTLTLFVRHSGCTFCRQSLDDLRRQLPAVRAAGVQPVVIHMSSPKIGRQLLDEFGLQTVPQISDPERRLYHAFHLRLGSLRKLFSWRVFRDAFVGGAVFKYGASRGTGPVLQLAGTFVLEHGRIVSAQPADGMSDRPDFEQIACSLPTS